MIQLDENDRQWADCTTGSDIVDFGRFYFQASQGIV
jgi:hypothetical protein